MKGYITVYVAILAFGSVDGAGKDRTMLSRKAVRDARGIQPNKIPARFNFIVRPNGRE